MNQMVHQTTTLGTSQIKKLFMKPVSFFSVDPRQLFSKKQQLSGKTRYISKISEHFVHGFPEDRKFSIFLTVTRGTGTVWSEESKNTISILERCREVFGLVFSAFSI